MGPSSSFSPFSQSHFDLQEALGLLPSALTGFLSPLQPVLSLPRPCCACESPGHRIPDLGWWKCPGWGWMGSKEHIQGSLPALLSPCMNPHRSIWLGKPL